MINECFPQNQEKIYSAVSFSGLEGFSDIKISDKKKKKLGFNSLKHISRSHC
jgi:hypothetical protein